MFNMKGLNEEEVSRQRSKFGSNSITSYKKIHFVNLLLESLNDPIIKILLIALGIKVLFLFNDSDIYEMVGIIVAVILASVISSLGEYGSEKAFQKLNENSVKCYAKVFRNSKLVNVLIEDIVVGDVVFLESGDKVCADGVILNGSVYVDESILTGETKEVFKENNIGVYRGSVVSSGSAIFKVEKVGNNTFYGGIVKDIQEKSPESPLKNRLRELANIISKIGYLCAFLVIFSYLFRVIVINNNFELVKIVSMLTNYKLLFPHLLYALTLGVTIIVVAVPEGLPMMITLVLSSNMKKLIKNNVLVRKLVGIETSGSMNILFTDKTGTITKGKLEVVSFVSSNGSVYKSFNEIPKELKNVLEVALIYNNSSCFNGSEIIGGNITERAILKFVNSDDRSKYKIISKDEFDSKKKYSSVFLDYDGGTLFYKGAYEILLDKCESVYNIDASRSFIKDKNSLINKGNEFTKEGYRVISVVSSKTSGFKGLTFIGFLLIKDEVRDEAKEGIKLVREAGIQTVMITGDNKLTAEVIAKEVGLLSDKSDIVITSEEMKSMSDAELKEILLNLRVVARSLPDDKKRLVKLSQEMGLVTGMTGDGVNDAPALKRSDVGFSMGSGTDIAKEVSDIVILDDNFISIAKTILFGRTIFKNIRKFIIFQLSVNLMTVTLSIIGPFFGEVLPITVIQMLWINMVMDTLAGVAYAFEPPLLEYMRELPKKRDEKIMNSYMINQIVITGIFSSIVCLFFLKSDFVNGFYRVGTYDKYLMTAFFGLFIFILIFNAFNARTHRLNIFANLFKNKVFMFVIMFIVFIQIFMIYFGGGIFRTTGLTFVEFDIMLIFSFSVVPFDFLRKFILKKVGKSMGV